VGDNNGDGISNAAGGLDVLDAFLGDGSSDVLGLDVLNGLTGGRGSALPLIDTFSGNAGDAGVADTGIARGGDGGNK